MARHGYIRKESEDSRQYLKRIVVPDQKQSTKIEQFIELYNRIKYGTYGASPARLKVLSELEKSIRLE
jgi:hypothetical protein